MRTLCLTLCLLAGCAHAAAPGPVRDPKPRPPVHVDLAQRAQEFAKTGDHVRAEQYYAAALEAGGDVDALLPKLLRVCVVSERYEAALAYAERFQPSRHDNPKLDLVLAALQLGLGQIERARRNLEQIVADNDAPQAHYLLGELYYHSLQDYGAADRHYREYLAKLPEGPHAGDARRFLLKSAAAAPAAETPKQTKRRAQKVRP